MQSSSVRTKDKIELVQLDLLLLERGRTEDEVKKHNRLIKFAIRKSCVLLLQYEYP